MLATIILLVILGVLAIGMEFFLPGGVLGIVGAASIAGSVVLCFTEYGGSVGLIATTVAVIFIVLALTFWLNYFQKLGPGKELMLDEAVKQDSALSEYQHFLNAEGVTMTSLRPAGKAEFGDRRVDVVAESGMIDRDIPVRVVKVEGSRVVVRKLRPPASAS